jgi:antitoxin component of MazEF toxin-antitoxin module
MIEETKLRERRGSLEATLPRAMTDRLNLAPGDSVFVVEIEGGILITPHDPNFARAIEAGERIAMRYQNALLHLAK